MIVLGLALIVTGLTVVFGSVAFRFFSTDVPASSEASPGEEPFRIDDEMWGQHDELSDESSPPAEYVQTHRKRRG
jgi:hypothetical protein